MQQLKNPKSSSACRNRGGVVDIAPVAVEQAGAPAPPIAVPVEVTDVGVAVPLAVDRSPKENGLVLPLLGNEVRMGEQVIENIGVQYWLHCQRLAEFVSIDPLSVFLPLVEIERHAFGAPLECTAFLVLLDIPAVRDERLGVAVDHMLGDDDFGVAESHPTHLGDVVASYQPIKVGNVGDSVAGKSLLNLVSQADIESNLTHGSLLFCDRKSRFLPVGLTAYCRFAIAEKARGIRHFLLWQILCFLQGA